jgi:hypothetical protein
MTIELTPTEKWKMDKWGMFSASEIDCLLTGPRGKTDTSLFGQGALTYIHKVARQAFTAFNEEDDNAMSYAMKMGKANEPLAFMEYVRLTGITMIEHYGGDNPVFIKHCEHSGCSPDAVAKDKTGRASFGAEIKAPQGDAHFDFLLNVKDQWDLKDWERKYYTQCQFSMMAHNCELWHWISWNEFFPDRYKLHIIEIEPDKPFQEELQMRLDAAIKIKNDILNRLNNI